MPDTVTDIIIDALADAVWGVLSDVSGYPKWNLYIRYVGGTLKPGATPTLIRLVSNRGKSTSHPTVTLYRPGREICMRDPRFFLVRSMLTMNAWSSRSAQSRPDSCIGIARLGRWRQFWAAGLLRSSAANWK